ncbi:hypothetical protein [Rhodobacter sp. 24-YEA-8]|uniref:hypothetical protein n=1 Tax=Rhodobacter sp. 24-YEA-8 TaxID=1884310 RepID=UPI000898A1BC|nr:hypothetical protein [Rhodobacter sp. 24-YEA-8]SEB79837.1 hypothetical protein SAMN05519105_1331 [Rhodobacter sp. 24-YEA-8]
MAFWTNLLNSIFETGKPIRAVDGRALRDNPIAIAEGAPDAPGLQHRALAIVAAGDIAKLQRLPIVASGEGFVDVVSAVLLNSGTLRARGTFWVGSQYEGARARFFRRRNGVETMVADLAGITNAGIVLTADIPFQPLDRITMRVGRVGTGVAVQASNSTFSTSGGDLWLLEKTDAADVVNSSRGS